MTAQKRADTQHEFNSELKSTELVVKQIVLLERSWAKKTHNRRTSKPYRAYIAKPVLDQPKKIMSAEDLINVIMVIVL